MSIAPQPTRRILATDLDGTLVGSTEGLSRLKAVIERYRDEWLLVYATGRTMTQARRLQAEEHLPEPDVWVTEVGAAITFSGGRVDEDWREKMAEHWDRDLVEQAAMACPEMTRQPEDAMGEFKLSFRLTPQDAERVLPALREKLGRAGVPVLTVYSSYRDLDIVPAAAGKGAAMRHLLTHYNVPLELLLTCGDSANDRDMLVLGGPAVAVGNAHEELVGTNLPETVLIAQAHYADGILEALQHYRWSDS